ncbi:MAG: hypothetical protein HOM21_06000 [Halobacteriovoraceae bacterium]|nr:hypothetical protein [Halobacteriovoraceae bacterium]
MNRLRKDFWHFLDDFTGPVNFKIQLFDETPPAINKKSYKKIWESVNSITYQRGSVRINDYHGKAQSLMDYSKEEAQVFGQSLEKLHELTYLLIHSRVGKAWDLQGLHRVHSCAFTIGKKLCLILLPSGGGKSTLLLELIKNSGSEFSLYSDDAPLIDSNGLVHPFPVRIGLEREIPDWVDAPEKYQLLREHHGKKHLISLKDWDVPVGNDYDEVLVMTANRHPVAECVIRDGFLGQHALVLLESLIIGLGLPMILEYFWETGFMDFWRKVKIALLRTRASAQLLRNSAIYHIDLGSNSKENAKVLREFLENRKN